MSGHTPGPWQYDGNGRIDALAYRKPTGFVLKDGTEYIGGLVALPYDCGEGTDGGNARRIVACVNALDGLSDDALLGGWSYKGVSAYAQSLEKQRDELESMARLQEKQVGFLIVQRDDLLAALRMVGMLRSLGGMLPGSHEVVQTVVDAADAAIAKATGEVAK